jgi:SAM-dependent methyltransferase
MSGDFDRYRHTYRDDVQRSIRFSGQDVGFFTDVKADLLVDLATRTSGDPAALSVLDVGCGVGLTDAALEGRFGSIHGVDVSEGAVAEAAAANPWATYGSYDGRTLPFDDDAFDLAFAICVLHHVDPPDRVAFTGEMRRVVRPGGLVVAIEHNPLNPLTRVAVSRCDFDEGVVLLRRKEARDLLIANDLRPIELPYVLFFPWRVAWLRRVERGLTWFPLGAQYFAVGRKGRAEPDRYHPSP